MVAMVCEASALVLLMMAELMRTMIVQVALAGPAGCPGAAGGCCCHTGWTLPLLAAGESWLAFHAPCVTDPLILCFCMSLHHYEQSSKVGPEGLSALNAPGLSAVFWKYLPSLPGWPQVRASIHFLCALSRHRGPLLTTPSGLN